jgi:intracellular septation protein
VAETRRGSGPIGGPAGEELSAMMSAARQLLEDFLSTIVFVAVYGISGRIVVAVGVGIAVAMAQFAAARWRNRALDAMQWMSLALVIGLGGMTLITKDPRFILIKPGLVHFAIGGVMLRRGWMMRYLPPIARQNLSEAVLLASGYAWAALMVALGAAIIIVALLFDFRVWAWFTGAGVMTLQVSAFLAQFAVFRIMIGRRLRARGPPFPSG